MACGALSRCFCMRSVMSSYSERVMGRCQFVVQRALSVQVDDQYLWRVCRSSSRVNRQIARCLTRHSYSLSSGIHCASALRSPSLAQLWLTCALPAHIEFLIKGSGFRKFTTYKAKHRGNVAHVKNGIWLEAMITTGLHEALTKARVDGVNQDGRSSKPCNFPLRAGDRLSILSRACAMPYCLLMRAGANDRANCANKKMGEERKHRT